MTSTPHGLFATDTRYGDLDGDGVPEIFVAGGNQLVALHADGGRMATKPYAAGGNYLDRMSDYCGSCAFDPRARVGDDACPFTSLYWDFFARHRERFERSHRVVRQVRALDRLRDLDAVRERARTVLDRLDQGAL